MERRPPIRTYTAAMTHIGWRGVEGDFDVFVDLDELADQAEFGSLLNEQPTEPHVAGDVIDLTAARERLRGTGPSPRAR